MTDIPGPVDLLVVGGGMAGLTAAASAATQGARVILVEQGEQVGGSAIYAGFAWTAPSPDVMAEVNPHGDPDLADVLLGGFARGVEWIRSLGVDCRPAVTVLRYGRGHQFDTTHYLSACEQRIKEHGGEVLTRVRTESLLMDEGKVHGARCRLPDGSLWPIEARWTLLATGGFQGDPVLRAQLIHPQAKDLQLRANPYSDGDGLRLGLSAGAAVGKPGAGFYGHLVPVGVALSDPSMFVDLALYYSEHALLFNLEGDRFVDETVGDHITTMALLAQPGARGLLVADAAVYREWIVGSYVEGVPGIDKFALASRRGARCAVAENMEEFDLLPADWGYPGPKIRAAIQAFNREIAAAKTPRPGRLHARRVIAEPPFYVIEAAPAITFTFTGLLTDRQMRVRSGAGGLVPGLLAAGADVGGLYDRAYAGGLAPALVFGLTAARTALAARGPAQCSMTGRAR
jgi:succinate dehydrogenase/fumarate reductase flavoprotein subunit